MGHSLQALVLPLSASERIQSHAAPTHPVRITASLLLVPVTDELYDFLVRGDVSADLHDDVFAKFHPALQTFAAAISGAEPYAYIETEYFGGTGVQAAAAWREGETLYAPQSAPIGPINEVLRILGVVSSRHLDEFEAAGLSRHRHLEEWLEEPRFGEAARPAPLPKKIRRLAFGQPQPVPAMLLDALRQVIAQVEGIADAYVVRCSMNGQLAENVLVVIIDANVTRERVKTDLSSKLRLLLATHEHLDVLQFHPDELPHDVARAGLKVAPTPRTRWAKLRAWLRSTELKLSR
ncbi:MAG: enhanced serine sensitivity protein SseB C-terminal domain-containing protein [Acidobacteriota bacterium]|nr:enhanced serine sensitivity protein SseB C-terminal domain-containing protein [Acidobacteriota bacterium]